MENQERKAYLTIGSVRALDIRVIFEDTEILYEGAEEDAPEEIKRLRASIDALIEKNERLEAELIKYREKESLNKGLAS